MKIVRNVCHHAPFVFQISDTDKIVVCCLEMSGKTIENSHANVQSCFKEMCQAAVKNQCKVMSTFHAERIILFIILLYCCNVCHSLVFFFFFLNWISVFLFTCTSCSGAFLL